MNSDLLATLHKAIKFPKWKKKKIKSFLNGLTVNVVLYACSARSVSVCNRIHSHTSSPMILAVVRNCWFNTINRRCVVCCGGYSLFNKRTASSSTSSWCSLSAASIRCFYSQHLSSVLINFKRSSTIRPYQTTYGKQQLFCVNLKIWSTNTANRSLPIGHAFHSLAPTSSRPSPDLVAIEFQLLLFLSQWQRIFMSFASICYCSLHSNDIIKRYGPRWRVNAHVSYAV